MITDVLLKKYSLISDQVDIKELRIVLSQLERVLAIEHSGSIVEFGCYVGTTSLFISRLLSQYNSSLSYHVFDSFSGLPHKANEDLSPAGEQFKAGELFATKQQFITNYKKANLPLPVIHKGWFNELPDSEVPPSIEFAFLDGDYYDSIKTSLTLITPKLTPSSVIIVDDYANEALPGVARAVDQWLTMHPNKKLSVQASLAIIGPL